MDVALITGTTREGRFSALVAQWITAHLAEHPEVVIDGVDLRDHPLPFFDGMAPARTGRDYARDDVARLGTAIDRADGYVVLTGEYNHGYPAVLKNALDYVYSVWGRKAVAFVSWGGTGGARGVEQLRLVAVELDMVPIRWAVHIPNPWFIQDVSGVATDVNNQAAKALLDHLTWWSSALKTARN